MRAILKEIAPTATEAVKWGSPVCEEGRILFAFSAYKNHINFMPTPAALEPFKEDLKNYKTGKAIETTGRTNINNAMSGIYTYSSYLSEPLLS